MIVVVTSNGNRYLNEAEMMQVKHLKDKAQVEFIPARTIDPNSPGNKFYIHDVERVIYTTKDDVINDPGKTIEELEEKLSKMMDVCDNLRKKYLDIETEYIAVSDKLKKYESAQPKTDVKIELRAVTPIGSDCTQGYVVDNCEGMVLNEFVRQAIAIDKYVSIDIRDANGYIGTADFESTRAKPNDIPDGTEKRIVKSAKASGGWGRMDYDVIIE